tara:strand:- start:8 stop:172 length:165 start_codon:yes stop_codon:yes gene_type:complete
MWVRYLLLCKVNWLALLALLALLVQLEVLEVLAPQVQLALQDLKVYKEYKVLLV